MSEVCPSCGRPLPLEYVDAKALWAMILPHFEEGTPGPQGEPARIHGYQMKREDYAPVWKLKRQRATRIGLHVAERIMTNYNLDPHLDEILLQD